MHRLRGEGLSVRAIAKRLGLARTTVHRWLIAGPERERDDGDIWGEEHDDDYPHMPWRFDGFEDEPPPVAVSPVRGRPGQGFQ